MAIGKSFNLKKQKMTRKLRKTSGLFKETLFIVIMLNLRVQLYVPKEESFPIPLKYIDVIRSTHTLDVAQENDLMTVGMTTEKEICRIRRQVSRGSHY